MPRFTRMLASGMERNGHQVEVWAPRPRFYNLPVPLKLSKWFGYIDQFIIFPIEVRKRLKRCSPDTLFVITDNGLGPWVPLVAKRHHVIHCHDFLAQLSALGRIPRNQVSWTGRLYQGYIRWGYTKGSHFISVSHETRKELHKLLKKPPVFSEVVYNGLNSNFRTHDVIEARTKLGDLIGLDLTNGYILHVGGNQWYKNRAGVIEIYNAWCRNSHIQLPLLLIGHSPSPNLLKHYARSPYKSNIHWLSKIDDDEIRLAYAGAKVFLFPSLAEGFGWPIAEAMACGCPVITTRRAPMTEVAGEAAFFISRCPKNKDAIAEWSIEAARILDKVITLPDKEREKLIQTGLINAKRFETEESIRQIEKIYQNILATH
ncbi:glycosyltransferase involved in cell wall biosynthesis [Pontibacter mucosus]|uniref:Glycosyltransferase involved in cell wall biosynthesis n=2 Tax=Pontibacter mucosus TaxID=1649266 RepID=A0A2T5YQ78_9BACT|nr:glycosyltransferase involved in cell wall biosynthesis [Pontibacter mucosus]